MTRKIIIVAIRVLLISLFLYASIAKLWDYQNFVHQLGRSPYVTNMAGFVAWFIPGTEIIIAGLLVFRKTLLLGLYSSFLIMLLFSGYIYAMLTYAYWIPCSCGGILNSLGWKEHLWFNVTYTLISLAGILIHKPEANATLSARSSDNKEKLAY